MAENQRTEIDAGLLEELRAKAREQSRTEGELLEEIVRSYLVLAPRLSNSLGEFFEGLERRRREERRRAALRGRGGKPRQRTAARHEAGAQGGAVARVVPDPGAPTRVAAYPY